MRKDYIDAIIAATIAIYVLLVVFVPILSAFVYAWNSPEGFEDDATPYDISGNCHIEEEELFVNGNCTITRSLTDDSPWIAFRISVPDVGDKYVKITTVFYDNSGRAVNFEPVVIDASAKKYSARIEWIMHGRNGGGGNYFPVASVSIKNSKEEKKMACSLGSGKMKTKDYEIKTVISGFAFVDDLESPYGSIKWKIP